MSLNLDIAILTSPVAQFLRLAERLCELAASEGIEIVPHRAGGPQYFAMLTPPEQAGVLAHLERYVDVCVEMVLHGEKLADDRVFLWRMFGRLGVRPPSDLMSHIEDEDIIEIYSSSYVQIYRNLKYFYFCSYTLDELLCRPYWELFHRDESVSAMIGETAQRAFSGTVKGLLHYDATPHRGVEISSLRQYEILCSNRIVCPLFDGSDRVPYAVNLNRILSCVSRLPAPERSRPVATARDRLVSKEKREPSL